MSNRTYKTMSAIETVERLRAGDYVDEARTADIIALLSAVVGAASEVASVLVEHAKVNEDHAARDALRLFCRTARVLQDKGIT